MVWIVSLWVLLGLHSAWYLVRCITLKRDFTSDLFMMLVICVLFPIISHLCTWAIYDERKLNKKILFKKRQ